MTARANVAASSLARINASFSSFVANARSETSTFASADTSRDSIAARASTASRTTARRASLLLLLLLLRRRPAVFRRVPPRWRSPRRARRRRTSRRRIRRTAPRERTTRVASRVKCLETPQRAALSAACANESARLAVAASPRARLCLHQNTDGARRGDDESRRTRRDGRRQNSRATAAQMSSLANPEGPHAHAVTTETTSKPSRSDVFVATSRSSSPRRALEPYRRRRRRRRVSGPLPDAPLVRK